MKTVIIVQARMTSTRLPGKVLKSVLGKTLLEYQIERLHRVKFADEIVIATTSNHTDDVIDALCQGLKVPTYRGSEEDILSRYYEAALEHNAQTVVRVTSDCPLIDPAVVDTVIQHFHDNQSNLDYATNALIRTYPRGMDTEVFSFQALEEAHREATDQPDREHVTSFIYRRPERYRLGHVTLSEDHSRHRWTVDTSEDFHLVSNILSHLHPKQPNFTLEDTLRLLQRFPEWERINAHVQQKTLGQ
ncbi:3-deoxy-manno-octulosonate cytidylyltransferase [compost metagenome]